MPDDPQLDNLKLPPHSLEAEQSVLGGLLLDNDAVDKVGDVLADADFYSDAHRLIYAHIVKLVADGKPADVVTVFGVARLRPEARLHRRPRVPRRAGAERADRGEHPPLRADRARPLDSPPARRDRRRHRGFGVQPARPERQGDTRPGRGEGAAHRRAGRARRAAVRRDRQAARRRRRAHRDPLTTATTRRTSRACRPASRTSTG